MAQICPNAHFYFEEQSSDQLLAKAQIIAGHPTPDRLALAKNLEWFQCDFAGVDRYVAPGALPEKVLLTNAKGAYGLAIAEHMLAGTFALLKRLDTYHSNQLEHIWRDEGPVTSMEDARVLLVGVGDIGGCYGRKAKALGSYVVGVRLHNGPKPQWMDEQYTIDCLDEELAKADIVAMSLPGTPLTNGMMNLERLKKMKPTALLVNGGRGTTVVTDDLNAALRGGVIRGAFLDVMDPEPLPAEHPLWDAPGALLTPHIAGFYHLPQTVRNINEIFIHNLQAYVQGSPLKNVIDRKQGY
jgi:phosphoglycerate dehydrogenase-like enzyme